MVNLLQSRRPKEYKFKQQIYYKLKYIEEYQKYTAFRSGSWTAIWLYLRNLHPMFNVFSIFDFGFKRLFRFSIVAGQLSLITLICWGAYSKSLEESSKSRGYGDFSKVRDHKVFYVSLLIGLLTLPIPKCFMGCFRTKMYKVKEVDSRGPSVKEKAKQETDKWHASNRDPDYDAGENNNYLDTDDGEGYRVALIDEYMQLKVIFITSMFMFWFFAMVVSLLYLVMSAQEPGDNVIRQMLAMTEKDAEDFVKTWYCAIFIWGYGVYNGLRVYIVSLLAPNQAKYEFEQEAVQGEDIDKCCGWGRCSCSQLLFIPRESVEIGLDVYAVIYIVQKKGGLEKLNSAKAKEEYEQEQMKGGKDIEMEDRKPQHLVYPGSNNLRNDNHMKGTGSEDSDEEDGAFG